MRGEHALLLLKEQKKSLKDSIDANSDVRTETKLNHQLSDLDYAIEILEEHQMDYE